MHLELLDRFYVCIAPYHGCLENWGCIYVQHLLRSNIACASFLIRMGLEKENLRIIGKAYSTNLDTLSKYSALGYKVSSIGHSYDYSEPFDLAIVRHITNEIRSLAKPYTAASGEINIL